VLLDGREREGNVVVVVVVVVIMVRVFILRGMGWEGLGWGPVVIMMMMRRIS